MDIIAQIISVLSCAGIILSFQMKNNRHLFLTQTIAAAGFGISYLMLGAMTGFLTNIVCFANTAILLNNKLRKKPILIAICASFLIISTVSALTYSGDWGIMKILEIAFSYLISIAQIFYTVTTWQDDGGKIRKIRLFLVTPAWLGYNIIVFSIGGIICEAFNIISIVVSFIRYGKDGFEK